MSTVYTMTRTNDVLPGTLDLLILRALQKDALHGWEGMANAIGRVMKFA
jgi:hypothetical protein